MPKCKENSFVSANVKKLADIGPGVGRIKKIKEK